MKKSAFAVPVSIALMASTLPAHAATVQLSDINKHPYEQEIRALVNEGIITGYPDGQFKPHNSLQRSDVVYLLGRYLENKGFSAPSDYRTKMRFKDLNLATNDALLKYAAIVNDAGVFIGANGYLLPNELLSRHHAALVLYRMVSKINGIEYAPQDSNAPYLDIQHLPEEDQKIITLFHEYQLVKDNYFNPSSFTTRGDFAHFLYGMRELSNTQLATIKSAEILNDRHVHFTFNDGRTYDLMLYAPLQLGVPREVSFFTFGQRYYYTVTMKELPKLDVYSVLNNSGSQFSIRFTKPVNMKAEYTAYEISQIISLSARDGQGTPSLASAKLSEDKMTLTVNTNGAPPLMKRYNVQIKNIVAMDGELLDSFSDVYTFMEDKIAPRLLEVKQIAETKALIQFSEPLRYLPTIKEPTLRNGKPVRNVRHELTADRTGILVDLSYATVDGKTLGRNEDVFLEYSSVQDYSNNTTAKVQATIQKRDLIYGTEAPKVVHVEQLGARQIGVTFNKPMNLSSLYNVYVIDGRVVKYLESVEQSSLNPNLYIFTIEDYLRGYGSIRTIDSYPVRDLVGNQLSFTETLAFTYNPEKAQVMSTEVMREDNSEYLYIYFDRNVDLKPNAKAILSGSYVLNGQRHMISSPIQADVLQSSDNKKVVRVLLSELLRGIDRENVTYSATLSFTGVSNEYGINVTDSAPVQFVRTKDYSYNTNELKVVRVETSYTNHSIGNGSIIRVTFNHAVDLTSAEDVKNYDLNRYQIDKVVVDRTTLKTVDIYVKDDTIFQTTSDYLSIENISALNSLYKMEPYYEEVYLNENVKPRLNGGSFTSTPGEISIYDSGVLTSANELTLTFTEAMADVASDVFIVRNANGEVIGSEASIHPTDKRKIVVRLDRTLGRNQKVTLQLRSSGQLTDLNDNAFDGKVLIFTTPYYSNFY